MGRRDDKKRDLPQMSDIEALTFHDGREIKWRKLMWKLLSFALFATVCWGILEFRHYRLQNNLNEIMESSLSSSEIAYGSVNFSSFGLRRDSKSTITSFSENRTKEWEDEVSEVLMVERINNMINHDEKRLEKGEDPVEGDLKPGWLEAAAERRKKYPIFSEGLDLGKKYLYYKLCNDYGAALLRYRSSLSGMLKEARKSGRVLVWMPVIILSHQNRGVIEIKDPALFFDKDKIRNMFPVEIMNEAEFFGRYKRSVSRGDIVTWGSEGPVEDFPTKKLLNKKEIVVERDYTGKWDKLVSSLNEDPELKEDTTIVPYAAHLVNLANIVLKELGEDFDSVHVKRQKIRKRQWPHLENDTSPEALVEKIPKFVPLGRVLYIATDESKEGFFDPLKKLYTVKMADDFKHLWARDSAWYQESVRIAGDKPPPTFDSFQKDFFDSAILDKSKMRVETFGHLATDPWEGLKTG